MTNVVKVTRRGQTTIPREIREKYGIKEGDNLVITDEDGKLVLKHIPKLEDLAGVDSGFGKITEMKREIDRMRESY